MDRKLKLNAKMNIAMFMCDFWIGLSKLGTKCAEFTTDKAKNMQLKERAILSEMLKEDYDESYKELIRKGIDVIKKDYPA